MAKSPTPWDAVMKEVLLRLFGQAGATVTTEYEVGRLPRTIDGVAVCDEAARAWLAEQTPLNFLTEHSLLEGKSETDYLSTTEFKLMMARAYLYLAQADLDDLSQLTVCAISAGFPRKVLRQTPKLVRFKPVHKALWKAETDLPFYVLVCSELDVVPKNYPFLLFATGKKRKEFLRALVQEAGSPYLAMALELYPRAVTEELKMSKKKTTYEEDVRYFLDYVGPEMIARLLPPESFAAVAKERLMSGKKTTYEEDVRYFLDYVGPETIGRWLSSDERAVRSFLENVPPELVLDILLERMDPTTLEAQLQARQGGSQG